MPYFTPEQRRLYADKLCAMIQEWLADEENSFDFEVKRGVERRQELGTGAQVRRANQNVTLTIRVNGGAQDTQGAPIVSATRLYRGKDG